MDRREFLKEAGLLGILSGLTACSKNNLPAYVPRFCESIPPSPPYRNDEKELMGDDHSALQPEAVLVKSEEANKVQELVTPEYGALLDTIAFAEGTDQYYNMMFGRRLFTDYSSHPVETGNLGQLWEKLSHEWAGLPNPKTKYGRRKGRHHQNSQRVETLKMAFFQHYKLRKDA